MKVRHGLAAWRQAVMRWPEPWRTEGRTVLADGQLALMRCRRPEPVFDDIVRALQSVEHQMQAGEEAHATKHMER